MGCGIRFSGETISPPGETSGCRDFLVELDRTVEREGITDGSGWRVEGFPHLRTDRFLAALGRTAGDHPGRLQWARWMRQRDLEARGKEIARISPGGLFSLDAGGGQQSRDGLWERVRSCSGDLLRRDEARPEVLEELASRMEVPGEYRWLPRVVGLYPLVAFPVSLATDHVRKRLGEDFRAPLQEIPARGSLRWLVPAQGERVAPEGIRSILETSARNPLRVPLPDGVQGEKLARTFAPVWVQDVAGPDDSPGRMGWRQGRFEIDLHRPTVYYYLSHAFWQGAPILQINYVVWYSGRQSSDTPWMERGRLDGVTLRISLDRDGVPILLDGMNNCGCYHFFVPRWDRLRQAFLGPSGLDPWVPQGLPEIGGETRWGVRVSGGRHLVQKVFSDEQVSDPEPYELVPYGELESLNTGRGEAASLFDAEGIARGSERPERFLLFSMGIPHIGSMRQRGHHAISFFEEVHFDDPGLLERTFVPR
jgi:hypothetical protein